LFFFGGASGTKSSMILPTCTCSLVSSQDYMMKLMSYVRQQWWIMENISKIV